MVEEYFGGLVGQKSVKEILGRGIELGGLAQTLIFVGKQGVGRKSAAFMLADALHYTQSDVLRRAGGNSGGVHPDTFVFSEILAEKRVQANKKTGQIKNAIDEVIRFLELSPIKSKYKVAIIDDTDMLSVQAQNALLKTLEEPRSDTILILVTEDEGRLLPTIVSRSRIIRFAPLTNDEIKKAVPDASPEIIDLADGSIGFAKQMVEHTDIWSELNRMRDFWLDVKSADTEAKISWADRKKSRQDALKFLETGLTVIRHRWLKNPTIPDARTVWLIQRTIYQIKDNVNARTALEALLLTPVFD